MRLCWCFMLFTCIMIKSSCSQHSLEELWSNLGFGLQTQSNFVWLAWCQYTRQVIQAWTFYFCFIFYLYLSQLWFDGFCIFINSCGTQWIGTYTVSALIKRYIVITVVENVGKSEDGMFYCWWSKWRLNLFWCILRYHESQPNQNVEPKML